MKRFSTAALAVLIAAGPAIAGSADPDRIPAGTKWVMHVDMHRMLSSDSAKGILELAKTHPVVSAEDYAGLDMVYRKLKGVQSVTIFGEQFEPGRVTMVVRADGYDPDEVRKLAGITAGEATASRGDHDIWLSEKDGTRYISLVDADTIVVATEMADAERVIDVLDGEAGALDSDSALAAMLAPRDGSFGVVAVADMQALVTDAIAEHGGRGLGPKAKLLTKVRRMRMEMGELEGRLFGAASMEFAAAEEASAVRNIIEGLLAAVTLMQPEVPRPLHRLARTVMVDQDDRMLTVTMSYGVEDMLNRLAELADLHAKRQEAAEEQP